MEGDYHAAVDLQALGRIQGGSWGADDPPLPGLNILYQLAVLGSTASFTTLPSTNEP